MTELPRSECDDRVIIVRGPEKHKTLADDLWSSTRVFTVGLTGFEPATPCPPALINSLLSLGLSISARNGARYDGPEGLIDNQLRDRTVRSMNDAQSIADTELWTTSDIAFYWRCGPKLAASRLSCVGAPAAIVFEGSRNKLWVSKEIRSWTLTKRKFPSRVAGSASFDAPLPRRRGPQIGRI